MLQTKAFLRNCGFEATYFQPNRNVIGGPSRGLLFCLVNMVNLGVGQKSMCSVLWKWASNTAKNSKLTCSFGLASANPVAVVQRPLAVNLQNAGPLVGFLGFKSDFTSGSSSETGIWCRVTVACFVYVISFLYSRKRPRNIIAVIPKTVDSCSLLCIKGRFYSFIEHFSHTHVLK